MLSVKSNMLAQNASRQLNAVAKKSAKNMEKLASGYRINRASDDAAGLAISETMRYRIRGLRQGADNTQDGISWLQIADTAMNEINDIINRMTELCVKAATETLTDVDRGYIDDEVYALKQEINRISHITTFNEIAIFDEDEFNMTLVGCPADLQIFDKGYDKDTGNMLFGGFIFNGQRYTWDAIDKGMVEEVHGEQYFNGGDYNVTIDGQEFRISCDDGVEVPRIKRVITLSADTNGIWIDGKQYEWSLLLDDEGKACTVDNIHDGSWVLNYYGAEITFSFEHNISSLADMARDINNLTSNNVNFSWEVDYTGNTWEKAVDMDGVIDGIWITDFAADILKKSQDAYDFVIRAGKHGEENGIWLEDLTGAEIEDSFRSWKDMEINSWDSGGWIDGHKTYSYKTDNEKFAFSFAFTLSNVTSLDSVIQGLDRVRINGDIITSYQVRVELKDKENSSARVTGVDIDFKDEVKLGRDFNKRTQEFGGGVDVTDHKATVGFENAENDEEVTSFEGDTRIAEGIISDAVKEYLELVLQRKKAAALAGMKEPEKTEKFNSLEYWVGAGNITTDNFLSGNVTLTNDMERTDGVPGSSSFGSGAVGSPYPSAFIDFKEIKDLSVLSELGFNSTCKTCNNHYSAIFKSSLTGGDVKTSASGYRYRVTQQGSNYTLEIDLQSLMDSGIRNGKDANAKGDTLAKAFVEIASEAYDFHYTQYAAEGSKLYIYDNRSQEGAAPSAYFDTKPYEVPNECDFSVTMKDTDPGSDAQIDLSYTHNFEDIADWVQVEMVEVGTPASGPPEGEVYYVKIENNDENNTYYYSVWDGKDDTVQLYSMKVSYRTPAAQDPENPGGSGAPETETFDDMEQLAAAYAQKTVSDTLTGEKVTLQATDYSYLKLRGDEKPNRALRAQFRSVIKTRADNSVRIKHSNRSSDYTSIPRFSMNTLALGLTRAGTETRDHSLRTLKYLKKASMYLAENRTIYGALQNRLEHTYRNNRNAEENLETADSRIRDTDLAKTMVDHVVQNILSQSNTSMLAHTKQQPDYILRLLQ